MKLYAVVWEGHEEYNIHGSTLAYFMSREKADQYAKYHSTFMSALNVEEIETSDETYSVRNGYICVLSRIDLIRDEDYTVKIDSIKHIYTDRPDEYITYVGPAKKNLFLSHLNIKRCYREDEYTVEEALNRAKQEALDISIHVISLLRSGADEEQVNSVFS